MRFPDQKFGVVILCNLDTSDPRSLAEKVADIYLDDVLASVEASEPDEAVEPAEKATSEPLSPEQLTKFEGTYYAEELDTTYTLSVRGHQLVAQHIRHDDILLTYTDDHFLRDAWFFPEIRFTRDDSGRVTGFNLTGNRVKGLYFGKRTH